VDGEVVLAVDGPVTQRSVLDALELRHPVLRGTIREHGTLRRRAFRAVLRLRARPVARAAGRPAARRVATGAEPLLVVGAMAGGEAWTAHRTTAAVRTSEPVLSVPAPSM
jgi:hypothetical protein